MIHCRNTSTATVVSRGQEYDGPVDSVRLPVVAPKGDCKPFSEVLQKFRLAAQGKSDGKQPPDRLRKRVETHFDPLPFYSQPLVDVFRGQKEGII